MELIWQTKLKSSSNMKPRLRADEVDEMFLPRISMGKIARKCAMMLISDEQDFRFVRIPIQLVFHTSSPGLRQASFEACVYNYQNWMC